MRILLINNYFNIRGGADACFFNTIRILEDHGHQVQLLCMQHPDNYKTQYSDYFYSYQLPFRRLNIFGKINLVSKYIYSFQAKDNIKRLFYKEKMPDIVHIHNFLPHISSSIIQEFKKHKIPIVMTLHDYKMVCPASFLFVRNRICQKCKGKRYYNVLVNKCIDNSVSKSLTMALTYYLNDNFLGLFDRIDTFISPSNFLISKLNELGFRKEIEYLPNPIVLQDDFLNSEVKDRNIVFFGRLTQEKGLGVLLDAMKGLDVKLKIIGDGPESNKLRQRVEKEKINNILFLGWFLGNNLRAEIQKSKFTVLPSIWYENCPFAILESFALGKPVIGSKIGGIPELIIEGETGLTFSPQNSQELKEKIVYLLNNPALINTMGKKANDLVKQRFNPEIFYDALISIYKLTLR